MTGEPPRLLAALISRLMRRRSLRQYIEFTGAALVLAAIAFLLFPKEWMSGEAADRDSIPVPAPTAPEKRFMAADATAWVDGVPIGAVRTKRILIDGKIHDLGAAIPPFGVRWTGRDEQGRLVFEGPDGVVRKRDMSR